MILFSEQRICLIEESETRLHQSIILSDGFWVYSANWCGGAIGSLGKLQIILRLLKIVPNDCLYPKTLVWHQSQVSSMFRIKVTHFLLDMVLDLLHPILDLLVNLSLLIMVPSNNGSKWFHIPKNMGFDTKTMSLAWPEQKLEMSSSKWFWTSYITFLTFRSICLLYTSPSPRD